MPETEVDWIFVRLRNGQVVRVHLQRKDELLRRGPGAQVKSELPFGIVTVWVDKDKVEHTGNDPQSNQESQNFKE